jgi:hypothetical protein
MTRNARLAVLFMSAAIPVQALADPPYLPCAPNCRPIDPCRDLGRCPDKGGPITPTPTPPPAPPPPPPPPPAS